MSSEDITTKNIANLEVSVARLEAQIEGCKEATNVRLLNVEKLFKEIHDKVDYLYRNSNNCDKPKFSLSTVKWIIVATAIVVGGNTGFAGIKGLFSLFTSLPK